MLNGLYGQGIGQGRKRPGKWLKMTKTLKKWDPKFNHFSYHRICKLEECEIEIHTNRKDHLFCEPNHQQLHWRRVRKQRRHWEAMVRDHDEAIKKLIEQMKENQKVFEELKMKYLHNGIFFKFLARHFSYDLYGSGDLRIMVDRRTKRVIGEFMIGKAPEIRGDKNPKF